MSTSKPRLSADQNAGIAIPRWEGQGALRLPWGRNLSLGAHIDYGFDQGSIAVSEDQPDHEGDTMGAALSILYTARLAPDFVIGIAGQLWLYSIPYVEYDTCVNCPLGTYTAIEHDRDLIPVTSIALLPTFEASSSLTLFAGVSMRNHPTIQKSELTIGPDTDINEEVESGPINAIASVGADLLLTDMVKLTAYLHRPIAADPVHYGASIGFMMTFVAPPAAPPGAGSVP